MVTAVAALSAWWAPGAPTMVRWWDGVLRMAFAGAVTWASVHAPRLLLPVLAGVTAIVAIATGSTASIGWLAACAGALIAGRLIGGDKTADRALAAGALVHALLRLHWTTPVGASAVFAAAVIAPLIATGLVRRRAPRFAIAGVLAAGGLASIAAVVTGATARSELLAGAAASTRAISAAKAGDVERARPAFNEADRDFEKARGAVDGPFGAIGRGVPIVGVQLRAASIGAHTGRDLARAGTVIAAGFRMDHLRAQDGRVDTAAIESLSSSIDSAVPVVRRARDHLATADSPWLLPSISSRLDRERARIDAATTDAENLASATRALPGLLGAHGARRYFLGVFTPAEARGLGGFIGNYGEITASNGQLALGRLGRTHELNAAAQHNKATLAGAPADYLTRYSQYQPQTNWQNVPMSPDFPSVAEVIRRLYPQSGGTYVDGVIAVDPAAFAGLLRLTGPVTVAPWPEPLTDKNAEQILLFDQYVKLKEEKRVTFLGDVAEAVAARLLTRNIDPRAAAKALTPALLGHHLMLNSATSTEQSLLERIGASGRMRVDEHEDFLAITNQNASGSKVDWFLHRAYRYAANVDKRGHVDATLDLTIRNDAPRSGLPDYIIGSAKPIDDPKGSSRMLVSVYSALDAKQATLNGKRVNFGRDRELGTNAYTFYFVVPSKSEAKIHIDLRGSIAGVDVKTYRLRVHRPGLATSDSMAFVSRGRTTTYVVDRDLLLTP
jgi:hypothetical protein